MMFKRVRNRILILNMAMASAVVIAAFAVIFGITYARERNENKEKLMYGTSPQTIVSAGPFFSTAAPAGDVPYDNMISVSGYASRVSPRAGLSFSMLVDSQTGIIEVDSMVDLPAETLTRAAYEVMKASGGATIEMGGYTWQYAVYPVTVLYRGDMGATLSVSGEFNSIRFLDVTASHRMLRTLAAVLLGLTVVILVLFYFISRLFANRAIRPMEEAWEKQSSFIADASHELKTPLSVINASCSVLYAETGETVGSQIKWVDGIMRAAGRMNGLVGGLLSLARMEEARPSPLSVPVDLSGAVTDAADEMEASAIEKGITINRFIEPDIRAQSDREHVMQILSILLDNAVKYADEGGEVTVSLRREKRQTVCSVRNTGNGIPPDELPKLFDRFYRGDPARSSENGGYGLGLAIAAAAADRIGARLTADSVQGEYAEFFLTL